MSKLLRHTLLLCGTCTISSLAQAQSPEDDPWAAVEGDIAGSESVTVDEVSPFSSYIEITRDYAFAPHDDPAFSRSRSGFDRSVIEIGSAYEHQFSNGVQVKLSGLARGQTLTNDDKPNFELDYGESYIHVPISEKFWIRVGALNISNGSSEVFKIFDRFNPQYDEGWGLDGAYSERLMQPGMQMRYTNANHQLQLALTGLNRADEIDQAYGDYDYFIQDRAFADIDENPDRKDFTPEWMLSYKYFGEDADFGLYIGSTYENHPVLKGEGLENGRVQLSYDYPRTDFVGLSGSYTQGSWLVRGDFAYFKDQAFFNNAYYQQIYMNPSWAVSQLNSDLYTGVVGLEYTKISKTVLSVEAKYQKLLDWQTGMRAEPESTDLAASISTLLMSDRLKLDAKLASLTNNKMYSYSIRAEYEFNDNLTGAMEFIAYDVNDSSSFYVPYENNDRAQIALKYNF